MTFKYDAYIQWIEYSLLISVQEVITLRHGCMLVAKWLEPMANAWIRVALKQIGDTQSLDFRQVDYFTCKIIQVIFVFCDDYCNVCNFFYLNS